MISHSDRDLFDRATEQHIKSVEKDFDRMIERMNAPLYPPPDNDPCVLVRDSITGEEMWESHRDYKSNPRPGTYIIKDSRRPRPKMYLDPTYPKPSKSIP